MVRVLRPLIPLTLAIITGLAVGCSGGGSVTSPSDPAGATNTPPPVDALYEPGATAAAAPYWIGEGSLDFSTGELTLTPMAVRDGQLTPVAEIERLIDATSFLKSDPCPDCFAVTALGLDGSGNITADFALKHAFSDTSVRSDLDVFDPVAIFYSAGAKTYDLLDPIDEDGNGTADGKPQGNVNLLANADGYTMRHDDLVESLYPSKNFTGNINPYIGFFTENNPSPSGIGTAIPWRKFPMGTLTDNKRVTFLKPSGASTVQYNFLVVISISWGQASNRPNTLEDPDALGTRLNPVFMNPEFNMKEAYEIAVNPGAGLISTDPASSTHVEVRVKDWQASYAVDPAYPGFPTYSNRQGLKFRSDVATVKMQVPSVSATLHSKTRAQRTSGEGTGLDPYLFEFDVTNDLLATPGSYAGLIAITDDYQLDGREMNGLSLDEVMNHFTAYQVVRVVVVEPTCPTPVAVAEADKSTACSSEQITFSSDNSSTPTGTLTQFAWDFDGVPGPEWTGTAPDDVQWAYTNSSSSDVTRTATLTVTNDCGNPASDSIDVIVKGNSAPTAVIGSALPNPVASGGTVDFSGTGSSDPDSACGDSIASYEWDFDYTAPTFDVDGTGLTTSTAYTNPGTTPLIKTAGLRVMDQSGALSTVVTVGITVNAPAPCTKPTARAGVSSTAGVSGQPLDFFAGLSTTNGPDTWVKYSWDWDVFDATPPEEFLPVSGLLPDQQHTYLFTGPGANKQFRARLAVYTSATCFDGTAPDPECTMDTLACDLIITITANTPPIALCSANPTTVTAGCPVAFTGAGSSDPDPTGVIVKYQWDFDDRNGINWATPDFETTTAPGATSHAYTNSTGLDETFNATLRVVDNNGTFGFCSIPMTVQPNSAPTAVADADPTSTAFSGTPVDLIDSGSSDADACPGVGLTYVWDFDASNGVILDPLDPEVDYTGAVADGATHIYTNPGTSPIDVTATLRVIDGGGKFDDDEVVISVGGIPPIPSISFAEASQAISPGVQYTYRIIADKPWGDITSIVNDNSLWDFTNTTRYPLGGTRVRQAGTPAQYPGVDLPGSTVIFQAPTYAGPNYEGRNNTANPIMLIGTSSNNGPGEDLVLTPPMPLLYPETIGTIWQHTATGTLQGIILTIDFDVRVQSIYGLSTTYAGVFNTLVEFATVTTDYEGLLTTTQREYTWVDDNSGVIVADFIEKLDGLGNTTNTGSGIVLQSIP